MTNFFKKKRILITGNTGFLGSWLTLFLLTKNSSIYGISNTIPKGNLFKLLNLKKKIKFFKFDINNEKKLRNFFKKNKINVIIHLAAEPLVYKAYKYPKETIANNFLSTLNLLNLTKNFKNLIFINFTTDKVYENKNLKYLSYNENSPLMGGDPYSFSKSCSDSLTKIWSDNFNSKFKFINIRSGNILGGADWGKKRIVTDIINHMFLRKKLSVRQPLSTRPWIHVYEVCNYILKLIQNNNKIKSKFSAWNIGPNKNQIRSVKWLINEFFSFNKNNIYKIYKEKKYFSEKKYLVLDNKKILKFLGDSYLFDPTKRVELTYKWYELFFKNRKELKKYIDKEIIKYIVN